MLCPACLACPVMPETMPCHAGNPNISRKVILIICSISSICKTCFAINAFVEGRLQARCLPRGSCGLTARIHTPLYNHDVIVCSIVLNALQNLVWKSIQKP